MGHIRHMQNTQLCRMKELLSAGSAAKFFLLYYGNFFYGNCGPLLRSIVRGDRLISLAVTA